MSYIKEKVWTLVEISLSIWFLSLIFRIQADVYSLCYFENTKLNRLPIYLS